MRNLLLSILFVISACPLKSQYLNPFGDSTTYNNQYFKNSIPFLKSSNNYDSIRPLSEINNTTLGEGYPYLSSDGLRLYFIKGNGPKVYIADRISVDSLFNKPTPLFTGTDTLFSSSAVWLSPNELDIYTTGAYNTDSIYRYSRANLSSNFGQPSAIALTGNTSHSFIGGISISSNQSELYLYTTIVSSTPHRLAKYKRINNAEYAFVKYLNPTNMAVGPGQLSKDDLDYYFSIENSLSTTKNKYQLFKCTRNSLSDTFNLKNITLLNQLDDTAYYGNLQPSVSSNGNYIVFVRNSNMAWSGNDFYIATRDSLITNIFKELPQENKNQITVFPNPITAHFNIQGLSRFTHPVIEVFDLNGRLIKAFDQPVNLSLSSLNSGIYLLRISDKENTFIEKVVKQ
jgi:hypothetical protein